MSSASEAKLDEFAAHEVLSKHDGDGWVKVSRHSSLTQAPSSQHSFTVIGDLSVLIKHVPYNMLKVFASGGCQPLSDVETLPTKMSLASFWSK